MDYQWKKFSAYAMPRMPGAVNLPGASANAVADAAKEHQEQFLPYGTTYQLRS